ncbi:hypothetical protein AOY20_09750 [Acinetobacter equi]|uniref:DUF4136 domain-containing protein n=1 Tax=Acinetobacter equi TaxID=1324350 RepID=A0A0N9VR15_9GAMM|nr:hypothetical protein [Acinetobacter equi]ALH95790.1 hypothetical protein AOY20_09750 [Acinetobacter equi]
MRRIIVKLIPASIALALVMTMSGCALAPTQPLTFNQLGEFSAYPLSKESFRIAYKARDSISYSQAQNITLVKAAQTAVLNGYQYFTILNGPTTVNRKPQTEVVYPNAGWAPGPWGPMGGMGPGWSDPFYGMPQTVTTGPAEIAYNIECYKNEQDAPTKAYDARLILQSIGSQYGVTPTGQVLTPQAPVSK